MKSIKMLLISLLLLSTTIAIAEDREKDPVEQRKESMKALGKSMKSIGLMFKNKEPFDAEIVKKHAALLAANSASDVMLDMYPMGSLTDESKSRAEIWQNWDEFSQMMIDLENATSEMAGATITSVEVGAPLFKNVSKSCSACHKKYRVKRR